MVWLLFYGRGGPNSIALAVKSDCCPAHGMIRHARRTVTAVPAMAETRDPRGWGARFGWGAPGFRGAEIVRSTTQP
jgi:hypothetical protein